MTEKGTGGANNAARFNLERIMGLMLGAMNGLGDREFYILKKRRVNRVTLREVSEDVGLSRERVRQIEVRAFEKLRRTVKAEM